MRWVCNTITRRKYVFEGVLLLTWKEVGRLKSGTAIEGLTAHVLVGSWCLWDEVSPGPP